MAKAETPAVTNPPPAAATQRPRWPQRLPQYTRSLLHIQVPVIVTLAAKKQPVAQVLELGPGSIIHFDKSCEEMLDLSVGDRRIAQGEAVKVGDKFGLRITSLILPDERFKPIAAPGEASAPPS
jgi:flagellar motor switch/type III secretory pathway protein FliN